MLERLFDQAGKPYSSTIASLLTSPGTQSQLWGRRGPATCRLDYLLLADADMELVVDDPNWSKKLNGGPAYDVKQVAGSLVYWNRRLVSRAAGGAMSARPTNIWMSQQLEHLMAFGFGIMLMAEPPWKT